MTVKEIIGSQFCAVFTSRICVSSFRKKENKKNFQGISYKAIILSYLPGRKAQK